MKFFKINRRFLPLKFHYGLFNGGTAAVQLTMPVYAKELKFSSFIVGTIYTILPLLGLIIKPLCGFIADKYKRHRTVLIVWEIIVLVGYFVVQYIPSPELPPKDNSNQYYSLSALSACSSLDAPPYLLAESGLCTWTCDMTVERCSEWNLTSYCSLYHVPSMEESCVSVPLTKDLNVTKLECQLRCPRGVQLKEDEIDDEDNFLTDSDTFATWQFWIFLLLLIGTWAGTAVVTTITDTVCIEICGGPELYGKQRIWASVAWGGVSVVNGFLIDAFSTEGEEKNYVPAFYLMLVPLLIDVVLSYFLEFNLPDHSESIGKDVIKIVRKPKTLLFMFWCVVFGTSLGLQWNFLFWYMEDLATALDDGTTNVIKTIEGIMVGIQTIIGEAPAFFFGGWIVSKVGYGHSMSLIMLAIGVRFSLYALLVNPWWALPIEVLQNNYGLFYTTMTSYAKIVSLPGTEATIQSVMCAVCEGIGVAIGSFIGGLLYDTYGGGTTFLIFGIANIVCVVVNETLEFIFKLWDKRHPEMAPAIEESIS